MTYGHIGSGETIREFRLSYVDRDASDELINEVGPVTVGEFTIELANYYATQALSVLMRLPTANGARRQWTLEMRDTNPSGDFPAGAEVEFQSVNLPAAPVLEANANASRALDVLKDMPKWGGSR